MTSYKPLWHLLIEREMKKKDLQTIAKISANTITRMVNGEEVSLSVLNKICTALGCKYEDIVEFIPDDQNERMI